MCVLAWYVTAFNTHMDEQTMGPCCKIDQKTNSSHYSYEMEHKSCVSTLFQKSDKNVLPIVTPLSCRDPVGFDS